MPDRRGCSLQFLKYSTLLQTNAVRWTGNAEGSRWLASPVQDGNPDAIRTDFRFLVINGISLLANAPQLRPEAIHSSDRVSGIT